MRAAPEPADPDDDDLDDDGEWVTVAEAERVAEVSRSTIRSWYRAGEIASRLEPGPHGMQRLVPLSVVLARGEEMARRGISRRGPGSGGDGSAGAGNNAGSGTDVVLALVEALTAQAAERERRAEERADRAERELRDALARAVAAETELALLKSASSSPSSSRP